MTILNVFDPKTTEAIFKRLENLNPNIKPQWGKMNAAQMVAHLNVTYDLAFGKTIANHSFFQKLILKLFVKGIVVGDKPYPKNSRTGADFIIADVRDFEKEKAICIEYIKTVESKGASFFEAKENPAFGVLTSKEWNNQFYKHIDHHFQQFGI